MAVRQQSHRLRDVTAIRTDTHRKGQDTGSRPHMTKDNTQVIDEEDWVVAGVDWIDHPATMPDRLYLKVAVRDTELRTFERLAAQRSLKDRARWRWQIAVIQRSKFRSLMPGSHHPTQSTEIEIIQRSKLRQPTPIQRRQRSKLRILIVFNRLEQSE